MFGKHSLILLSLLVSLFCVEQASFFALNTIKPYDSFLWGEPQEPGVFEITAYAANSFKEKGVRWDHTKLCDVLQIYNCDQNTLAMVRGFDPASEIGQYAIQLNGVSDDGVRGHMIPYASFHMTEFGIGARYWLIHNLYVGLYLPFVRMRLSNVSWQDCTQLISEQDYLTKDLLTNQLASVTWRLGCLDSYSGWKRIGIGDTYVLLAWDRNFEQSKPILTDVRLSAFGGFSLPTGRRVDTTKLFSIPFGYDGAPGLLFGGRLRLTWKHHLVGGVEADFIQLVGNARTRRIKTDNNQSELLLLARANTLIDWGFLQRYHLYVGAYNIIRGFSFDVGYMYQKQGASTISICGNDYVTAIAQASAMLCPWTIHTVMVDARYDWGFDFASDSAFVPRIGFFYQHDFKGRQSILLDKFGFSVGFSF